MDGNFSPSASGEANIFKNEKHYHSAEGGETPKGIIRRIREAIDPSGAASVYVDAAQTVSRGLVGIAEDLKKAGTPAAYAPAQAYEIYRGAQKLTNVGKAFDYAEAELGNKTSLTEPGSGFVNNFVSSVENVSDEEILALFGKILAGEMERPGSISKKTMSILDDMSRREAAAFQKLCERAIEARVSDDETRLVSFVWSNEMDDIAIPREGEEALDALGLTRMHFGGYVYGELPFQQDGTLEFSMGGRRYLVRKGEGSLHISYPEFTVYGRELAMVCGIGCDPEFQRALLDWFEYWGATVEEME